jgi:hypothetical protein
MNEQTTTPVSKEEEFTATTLRLRAALDSARSAVPESYAITLLARHKGAATDADIVLSDEANLANAVAGLERLRVLYQGGQAPEQDFGRWHRVTPAEPGHYWYWPGDARVMPVPLMVARDKDGALYLPSGQIGLAEAVAVAAVDGFWQRLIEPTTGMTALLEAKGKRARRALRLVKS